MNEVVPDLVPASNMGDGSKEIGVDVDIRLEANDADLIDRKVVGPGAVDGQAHSSDQGRTEVTLDNNVTDREDVVDKVVGPGVVDGQAHSPDQGRTEVTLDNITDREDGVVDKVCDPSMASRKMHPKTVACIESKLRHVDRTEAPSTCIYTGLRSLQEIVDAVRASKRLFDERCDLLGNSRQTMEQHLYMFLSKRCRLKVVTQKKAQELFALIEQHAPEHCEVAAFGRVLQNRLDEAHLDIQDSLKQKIKELLLAQFASQYRGCSPSRIEAAWSQQTKTTGISYADCEIVARHLLCEEDAEQALRRLRASCGMGVEGITSDDGIDKPSAIPSSSMLVRYHEFIQAMLRTQLDLREAHLTKFLKMFEEVDTGGFGVLSASQVPELIDRFANAGDDGEVRVGVSAQSGDGGDGGTGGVDGPPNEKVQTARGQALALTAANPRSRYTFSDCTELLSELLAACSCRGGRSEA